MKLLILTMLLSWTMSIATQQNIEPKAVQSTPLEFRTAQTGDYETASTWMGGIVPFGCANITISAGHTLRLSSTVAINNKTFEANTTLQFMNTTAMINTGICP